MSYTRTIWILSFLANSICWMLGQEAPPDKVTVTAPSKEALEAASSFQVKEGFEIEVYASEPLLANPVSMTFDASGKCYVVESHRRRTSVYDIRRFPDWLDRDFAFTTVADRSAFLKKELTSGNPSIPKSFIVDRNKDGLFDWHDLEVESERIVLIEDLNLDGQANQSKVFADGFRSLVSGVAAGVLARGNQVWFTCIPDLWLLEDNDANGVAEKRQRLHHGFGVHIAFGGHDMHGLTMGPDGRLYFSIADRGAHVEHQGETILSVPHTGSIFRCEPDGSELTLFASGLRNPQELAFDAEGNLWTADNNGDGGDQARLVYVVEGGDSGWTMGWQWLPNMGSWNSEGLWKLADQNMAYHLIPPVAHIGHGPAGFAFYPGTGMPESFHNHFFLCDFPGGIRHFKVQTKGAGFEVPHSQDYLQNNQGTLMDGKMLWGLAPVDVTFGPKPGIYVADWIQGWEKTGKGRIFRVAAKNVDPTKVEKVQQLLRQGFDQSTIKELGQFLSHHDLRVRSEAQYELVQRFEPAASSVVQVISGAFQVNALQELTRIAQNETSLYARYHAIWGLGQLAKRHQDIAKTLLGLLEDPEPLIVHQAARVLADRQLVGYYQDYLKLIQSTDPKTQFFGLKWLWKTIEKGYDQVQHSATTQSLVPLRQCDWVFECLEANQSEDPYIRHAAVMALASIADIPRLTGAHQAPNMRVRMAAALALRRLGRPEVAAFLQDPHPQVIVEAARAIHDLPMEAAQGQLAQLVENPNLPEPVLLRAVNAQFRLGQSENAAYLISLAQQESASETVRIRALKALKDWSKPPARDAITGLARTLPNRDPRTAAVPLKLVLGDILRKSTEPIVDACLQAMLSLDLREEETMLLDLLIHDSPGDGIQVQIIRMLAEWQSPLLGSALLWARTHASEDVLNQTAQLQSKLKPEDAIALFSVDLKQGGTMARQSAIKGLASLDSKEAWTILEPYMRQLLEGNLAPELMLEIIEVLESNPLPSLRVPFEEWKSSLDAGGAKIPEQALLAGGNERKGEDLFKNRQDLGCARCHSLDATTTNIGPSLKGHEKPLTHQEILASILTPNASIAEGYQTVYLEHINGEEVSGVLKSETPERIAVLGADGKTITMDSKDVASRRSGLSLMPEGLAEMMTPRELRDLVAFLAKP